MKKNFLVTLVVGGLFMSSCTEDIYNPDKVKEDYEQNFVDLFGEINPNQDWNAAELKSVTVDPGSSTEVQIYAKGDYAYKLVGNFKNVSGKQALKFDAAKSLNDFVVLVGGEAKFVKNGDEVSFTDEAVTRTYYNDVKGVWSETDTYKEFEWNKLRSFVNKLEEGNDNTGSGVPVNFDYVAEEEPITIYPIYWNAHYYHRVGIYIKGEDGKVKAEYPIYRDKMGDELQYRNGRRWKNASGNESVSFDGYRGGQIRSKGFTIDLPEGTVYGFYIEVSEEYPRRGYYNDGKYYTNAQLNNPAQNMASSFKEAGDEYTYLGFDDDNKGDSDLNDLMFIADPEPKIIDYDPVPDPDPEPEPTPELRTWIIAAEDLGETDDYDFNDVVFSVTHTFGETTATITPLAAGGSLETYVSYNGAKINEGKEFHSWFGDDYTANADGTYDFINTQTSGSPGQSFTIVVGADFTMSTTDDPLGTSMGGFSITVGNNTISAPETGTAPQMICVPAGWKWPVERISVKDAYPDFSNWVTDPTSYAEWYKNPVSGQVIE